MSDYNNKTECGLDSAGHCMTCSDEALPAKVLRLEAMTEMALVTIDGATTEVDVSLVGDLVPGDMVLVHGGVAIERLDFVIE